MPGRCVIPCSPIRIWHDRLVIPTLSFRRLSGHGPAARTIKFVEARKSAGYSGRITLDFRDCESIYANGAAPLAAVIDHYREGGISFEFRNMPSFLRNTGISNPRSASNDNLRRARERWNTVWQYDDSDQVFALAKWLIEDLIERLTFGPGLLEALSWCLYEILDNVLLHARSRHGFLMLQYMPGARRLAVTIADSGVGIHRSFVEGKGPYRPVTASDALDLSIKQWTSSTGERRGNGLFGLAEVVRTNVGTLDLRSGRAALHASGTQLLSMQLPSGDQLVIDSDHHCTVVDFQLTVANPVSIAKVLGSEPAYNFELDPLRDDAGVVVVAISEYATKVATREGAMALRVRLLNYFAEGAEHIALDFLGVGLISSSFADETIGRLVEHYGLQEFARVFSFRNLSEVNRSLVDRAIIARSGGTA